MLQTAAAASTCKELLQDPQPRHQHSISTTSASCPAAAPGTAAAAERVVCAARMPSATDAAVAAMQEGSAAVDSTSSAAAAQVDHVHVISTTQCLRSNGVQSNSIADGSTPGNGSSLQRGISGSSSDSIPGSAPVDPGKPVLPSANNSRPAMAARGQGKQQQVRKHTGRVEDDPNFFRRCAQLCSRQAPHQVAPHPEGFSRVEQQ